MLYRNQPKILRKKYIYIFYFFLIILVFFRYYKLQILEYEKYKLLGEKNSIMPRILNAPRGIIYDRNGFPIVDNKFIYDINIIPNNFNEKTFNYNLLEQTINVKKNYLDSIVNLSKTNIKRFRSHLVKRHIRFKTKSILEESKLDIQGLYFSEFPIRTFTQKCKLSHVLGYLKQNEKGETIPYYGIEKIYHNTLKGINGVEYYLTDSRGINQGIVDFENKGSIPTQGDDLVLTIDVNLQSFCEKLVKNYKGSVIVSNPKTGGILALLSFPDYNLNSFVGPISHKKWLELNSSENNIFINRSIQSTYSPGSIFKLVLATIVLDKDIINKDWKVNCSGQYHFFDTVFRCWKEEGHGTVNLNQAIQQSCNIYFYNLMQKIDFNVWSKEIEYLGFGQKTGIDLSSEKKGLIPNRSFMNKTFKNKGGWSKGHLLNLAIGQGETLVTPIQINNLINLICNEGYVYRPHLNKNLSINKTELDIKNKVWKIIRKSMFDAVNANGGTAYKSRLVKEQGNVYGKTGTVQVCSNCDILPNAWFAGFVESNNKKYSVTIIIENGGKGSNIPSEMAGKIFEYLVANDI